MIFQGGPHNLDGEEQWCAIKGVHCIDIFFVVGSTSTPNQTIQKDVQEIQMTQQQFLAYYIQMQQEQQQQPGQIDPGFQAASQEQVTRDNL